ncbi:MAG: c-type cytochrome [Proteobacteria bacterium]|nr:c-type cytochrome [Pseudomonadota bacterium]MBI3498569.1 c-type cytochrome [Pseudomonadota bacterium]
MLAYGLSAAAVAAAAGTVAVWLQWRGQSAANADDPRLVAEGRAVYAVHCASCHGKDLEGQPNWRERLANGRLPAPPHDADGHTWHHPDRQLFTITKDGLSAVVPGYESDMPAFGPTLSDRQIWAVLAFIKNSWPQEIRLRQEQMNQTTR